MAAVRDLLSFFLPPFEVDLEQSYFEVTYADGRKVELPATKVIRKGVQ